MLPKRISPIPVSLAKNGFSAINNRNQAETVHEVLNLLGDKKLTIRGALAILDNAKETLLCCTRVESRYLLDEAEYNETIQATEEHRQSNQSCVHPTYC